MDSASKAWIDREVAGCCFGDERLGQRLRTLLDQMAGAMGVEHPSGLPVFLE